MKVSRLKIANFRGIQTAELQFTGHTLLIGGNNVGKSTICEALDLVLGPDRLNRSPVVEEFDFRNAGYLAEDGKTPVPIRIEVVLTELTDAIQRQCAVNLEFWKKDERRLLGEGEISQVDSSLVTPCLRLTTIAKYDPEEDQFVAKTVYGNGDEGPDGELKAIPNRVKRAIGFLYLRALRTGSRALSLERGSLLDIILRMKELRTGLWERFRTRLAKLDPPIDADASELTPILEEIEARLGEYIPITGEDRATRLFVSQLTREHLRKTIAFFLTLQKGDAPVPFQEAGTGTLNTLVLALLTFIAEMKKDNVIFAMEEPEVALPPHTQRRIANYLFAQTTQCFVTSHSPYIIERFEPQSIIRLTRSETGMLEGMQVVLPASMKAKAYRAQLRRAIAECMLGKGAIVGEGQTEQYMLLAVAKKMEDADSNLFPLDLAGITVVNTEGDGNLDAMGTFLQGLGIPAFAFFDKKNRKPEEIAKIQSAFTVAKEIAFKGAEALLAAEIPVDRQWQLLELIRAEDSDNRFKVPTVRPSEDVIRELATAILKGQKGEGAAARLIDLCSVNELPPTIVAFLRIVHGKFPKPQRPKAKPADAKPTPGTEVIENAEGQGANVSPATPAAATPSEGG